MSDVPTASELAKAIRDINAAAKHGLCHHSVRDPIDKAMALAARVPDAGAVDVPNDGLVAPVGFEIERWPDGSPRMICIRTCDDNQHWIGISGTSGCGRFNGASHSTFADWRIALRKLPERRLLNFREAVEAVCNGETVCRNGAIAMSPHCSVSPGYILDRFDETDFYVQD